MKWETRLEIEGSECESDRGKSEGRVGELESILSTWDMALPRP